MCKAQGSIPNFTHSYKIALFSSMGEKEKG
jgi:hypothetical protein